MTAIKILILTIIKCLVIKFLIEALGLETTIIVVGSMALGSFYGENK